MVETVVSRPPRASDRELLAEALARLEQTGELEYRGEYGAEITTFIPFAFWLKQQGLLAGRTLVTYRGMRPYYYFLDDEEYREKPDRRDWEPFESRIWPTNSSYTATRQPWHVMPDYRRRYGSEGLTFDRPVLFIQNKFTVEWGEGPINYLPLDFLARTIERATARFDVVYSRPRTLPPPAGFSSDHNSFCDYPDLSVVRRFPQVLILEDHCEQTGADYNLTKLQILAKTWRFIAVQGGGAHLLACFGDSVMALLHRRGEEDPHAYAAGPYKYLAETPPWLFVARDWKQLWRATGLVCDARHADGKFSFHLDQKDSFLELRM